MQNCAWKHQGSISQPETTKALRHSFTTAKEDGACVLSRLSVKCLGSQANPIFSVLCTAVIPLRVCISLLVTVQEVEGGRKTESSFSSAVLQAPDTDPGKERLPPAQPQAFSSHPFLCTCLQTTRCLAGGHRAADPPCSSLPHWH